VLCCLSFFECALPTLRPPLGITRSPTRGGSFSRSLKLAQARPQPPTSDFHPIGGPLLKFLRGGVEFVGVGYRVNKASDGPFDSSRVFTHSVIHHSDVVITGIARLRSSHSRRGEPATSAGRAAAKGPKDSGPS
jgi:hypothetical protein